MNLEDTILAKEVTEIDEDGNGIIRFTPEEAAYLGLEDGKIYDLVIDEDEDGNPTLAIVEVTDEENI